jgi:hypothetical protein
MSRNRLRLSRDDPSRYDVGVAQSLTLLAS